jgi:ankyrin repeat protein
MRAVNICPHGDVVKLLLAAGANPHLAPNHVGTLLMCLCRSQLVDCIETVLGLGVAVDEVDRYGRTALIRACQLPYIAAVEMFLAVGGANVNHTSNNGDSALTCATQSGHTAVVDTLLAHGTEVNHARLDGTTALSVACGAEVISLLLQAGADVDVVERVGDSILFRY